MDSRGKMVRLIQVFIVNLNIVTRIKVTKDKMNRIINHHRINISISKKIILQELYVKGVEEHIMWIIVVVILLHQLFKNRFESIFLSIRTPKVTDIIPQKVNELVDKTSTSSTKINHQAIPILRPQ